MAEKFKKILATDVFKDFKTVSTQATFTESAYEYMKHYQESGLELGYHDLTEDQFIGWCAAYGLKEMISKGVVIGSYKMDSLKTLAKSKSRKKD